MTTTFFNEFKMLTVGDWQRHCKFANETLRHTSLTTAGEQFHRFAARFRDREWRTVKVTTEVLITTPALASESH